jgi:hypothetical protein
MPEKLEIDSGMLLPDIERHFRVMAGPGPERRTGL